VGDGTTDDTAAIQAAFTHTAANGRGIIYMPPGTYRTTATLSFAGSSITLKGSGAEFATKIQGDFVGTDITDSPIIKINGRYCGISDLLITSSSTREAASNNDAHGIYIEATDSASNDSTHGTYRNILIDKQPGDGILGIARVWLSLFENIRISNNTGHGMRFDNGELTGRTNKSNPGEVNINNCMIYDNGGHALQIGNDDSVSNRGFRFLVENLDCFRNAEAAGKRKSADQVWAFCDTSRFESCAFDGHDLAGTTKTTSGLRLYGRTVTVTNSRFLNVVANAVILEEFSTGSGDAFSFDSYGFIIENITIFNDVALDPVVRINTAITNVEVKINTTAYVDAPVDTTYDGGLIKQSFVRTKLATQIVNNTTTFVDVDDLSIPLLPKERVQFKFVVIYRGSATADIKLKFDVTAGSPSFFFAPSGSVRVSGSLAPIAQQVFFTTASSIGFGSDSTDAYMAVLTGEIRTNGDGANLNLQFAQGTADASDTEILAQSYVTAWKS